MTERDNRRHRAKALSAVFLTIIFWSFLHPMVARATVTASFTQESVSLSIGEIGTWQVQIDNQYDVTDEGTVEIPLVNGTLVVDLPDDFTVIDRDGGVESTSPHQLTWTGINLGDNESFLATYQARPDCGAGTGRQMSAVLDAGTASATSSKIFVGSPAIEVSLLDPAGRSVTQAQVGDVITWNLTISNSGNGSLVQGADVSFELGSAFSFVSIASATGHQVPAGLTPGSPVSWNSGPIADTPGSSEAVYQISAMVIGCNREALVNLVSVNWADGAQSCLAAAKTATSSVALEIREPDVAITIANPSPIGYCGGSASSITISNDGDGPATGFTLSMPNWPGDWQLTGISDDSDAGDASFDAGSKTFSIPDIGAHDSVTVSFQVVPNSACDLTSSASLLFFPEYSNECGPVYGTVYHPPIVGPQSWSLGPAEKPTFTVTKTGPQTAEVGETDLVYQITVTYSGPEDVLPYEATITDEYPDKFSVTDPAGGTDHGNVLEWTHTFTAADKSVTYTVVLDAPTDPCDAFANYCNTVTVAAVPGDCHDCPGLIRSATLCTFLTDTKGSVISASSVKRLSDNDVCSDIQLRTCYTFDSGAPGSWNEVQLDNQVSPAGLTFTGIDFITVNGTDYSSSCGTGFPLDLGCLDATAAPAPGTSPDLCVTYRYAVENSGGSFVDESSLLIGDGSSYGSGCAESPAFNVRGGFTVAGSSLGLSVNGPDTLNVCETKEYTISLSGSRVAYDGRITLAPEDHYHYLETVGFSNILDSSGTAIDKFDPTDNGDGTYTWDFASQAPGGDLLPQGSITVSMRHDCTSGLSWHASGAYNNVCENGTDPPARSASDSDSAIILKSGNPTLHMVPETIYAVTPYPAETLYVVNGGSGPMLNVDLVVSLGTDLEYWRHQEPTAADTIDGVVVSSDQHTVTFHYDEIAPGARKAVDLSEKLVGCSNLGIHSRVTWGCDGQVCDTRTIDSVVLLSFSDLVILEHSGAPIDYCGDSTSFTINATNTGKTDIYNPVVKELLPPGVTFVTGSSNVIHSGGYGALTGLPTPSITEVGDRQQLTWDFTGLLPKNGDDDPAMQSGAGLTVTFDAEIDSASCDNSAGFAGSSRQAEADADYQRPCELFSGGARSASAPKLVTVAAADPRVSVRVQASADGVNWSDSLAIDSGSPATIHWRITVTSSGSYLAKDVVLTNVLPNNVGAASEFTRAPGSGAGSDADPYTWNLGNLAVGESVVVDYITANNSNCDANSQDLASVQWGCCASPALETAADAAPLYSRPVFSGAGAVSIRDRHFTTCGGDVEVTLNNGGSRAPFTDLKVRLPTGYEYDPSGTCTLTAPSTAHGTLFCTPDTTDSAKPVWNTTHIDFVDAGETITIGFRVKPDGSSCDTTSANDSSDPDVPIEALTHSATFDYQDLCGNSYQTAASTSVNPEEPDLDLIIDPVQQTVNEGATASWTVTVQNDGNTAATGNTLTLTLGAGYTAATITDDQGCSRTDRTLTCTVPDLAKETDWQLSLSAVVSASTPGPLLLAGHVEGVCKDQGGATSCNHSFDDTKGYVAGSESIKSVDKTTANVGELLTYTVTAVFANTEWFRGVVLIDTLPPNTTYVAEAPTLNNQLSATAGVTGAPTEGQVITWNVSDFQGRQVFERELTVRINDAAANHGNPDATVLTNQLQIDFGIDYDGDGTSDQTFSETRSAETTVTEPKLSLVKTVTPDSNLAAGSSVTVSVQVNNTGDGPARALAIEDLLNDTNGDGTVDGSDTIVFSCSDVAEGTTPAGWTFAKTGTGDACKVAYSGLELAAGAGATLTFTAEIANSVVTASSYTNRASTTGDSLPATDPEFGNDAYNRAASASGQDDFAVYTASSDAKTLVSTSEDSTSENEVAVGEVAIYRLAFSLPPGVTRQVSLADQLPAGLAYLTASAILDRSDAGLTSALDPGSINENTPPGDPVAVTLTGTDTGVELELGDVQNSSGADAQYILTLKCVVKNSATNNAGEELSDRAVIGWETRTGTVQSHAGTPLTVTVVEPNPTITKTADRAAAEAGDAVQFDLELCNPTGDHDASAFDWVVTDLLPASEYENAQLVGVATGSTGASVSPCSGNAQLLNGNALCAEIDQLDPGECVTVTYQATVKLAARFGQTIPNTAGYIATSLPGEHGSGDSTPGNAGETTGERTGTGGVNDLTGSDTASVVIGTPSISKDTVPARSWYAIGEQAHFKISVSVPAGTSPIFKVDDQLPSGLAYVTESLSVTLPAGAGATNDISETNPFFSHDSGTGVLAFDFGQLTVPNAGTVLIEYDVEVMNLSGNQDGTSLENQAVLTYQDPTQPTDPTAVIESDPAVTQHPVRVGEPNLEMTKTITAGAAGSEAGDTVGWQIEISNTGHTTAYQVNWSDQLPYGLGSIANADLSVTGTVYRNGTAIQPNDSDLQIETRNGAPSDRDTLSLPALQMAPGSRLTITFDTTLMDSVIQGEVLNNETAASYTSLVDGGRDDSTEPGSVDDDLDDDLNNYRESAGQSLTVATAIAIDKTLSTAQTAFAIGRELTYQIVVSLIEGVTPQLKVYDLLPEGLSYVSHNITAGNLGIAIGNATYNDRLGSGRTVGFDCGDVANPDNGEDSDDYLMVEITARVDNSLANQNQVELKNGEAAAGSNVYVEYGASATRLDFDHDGATPGLQGLPVTVVEPELVIQKEADPQSQALGDRVTYTITVRHSGQSTADAYDLLVVDTLPEGVIYQGTSWPDPEVQQDGRRLLFRKSVLTRGAPDSGQWQFTVTARIDPSATVGASLENQVELTWKSLPDATGLGNAGRTGDDAGEPAPLNDYAASDSAAVTGTTAAVIDAVKSVTDLNGDTLLAGETVEYTILLKNTDGAVSGTIFQDQVPAHCTYVAGSLTTTKGTAADGAAPDLAVEIGDMTGGEMVTITFRATVNADTPSGTVISNQGLVDSDATVPEPTDHDGNDANGDQPTTITVAGDAPEAALYAWKFVEWADDPDHNGTISPGDTMRYWVMLENTGRTTLTNVGFSDFIPAGLSFNGQSAAGDGILVVTGAAVTLTGMTLVANDVNFLWFELTIDDPLADLSGDADPNTEVFRNQGTASSDQTGSVPSDANGDPTDGSQVTEFTAAAGAGGGGPALDVEKRWSLASDRNGDGKVNPGDTLQYRIIVRNDGATRGDDVRLQDIIPVATAVVAGSVSTTQGVVLSENPVGINLGSLDPGDMAEVVWRVQVDAGTPDGTVLSNQAQVTAAGGLSEPSDDNGADSDGKNPTLTPVEDAAGGGGGSAEPSGLSKVLQASSEPGSNGTEVLIGEVATFRLSIQVPVGVTRHSTLLDMLPAGLAYVADSARLSRTFDTGLHSSTDPGDINSAAAGMFVPLTDGVEVSCDAGTGRVEVFLGDIINSDNDADAESYTLELQVLVKNTAGNRDATSLTNQGTFSYWNQLSREQTLVPVTVDLVVREPAVQITKTADPPSLLTSGGRVRYTITVTNQAGAAPAYDLRITDTLPAAYTSLSVLSITPATGVTDNSSGTVLDLAVATLEPGTSLAIVYTADAPGLLTPGVLLNTAKLVWTSLPGDHGSGAVTSGDPGTESGERTGYGAVNDYSDQANAGVNVGTIAMSKEDLTGKIHYPVADVITYRVARSVLPGNFDQAVLTDILDQGLTYVAGSLSIDYPAGVSSSNSPSEFGRQDDQPVPGQETLVLDFGILANNSAESKMIVVTYRVVVDDIIENQDGVVLSNNAVFSYRDPGTGDQAQVSDQVSVIVAEPSLEMTKEILSGAVGSDAGDSVRWRVTIRNTGHTTAYRVSWRDVLPDGLFRIANVRVIPAGAVYHNGTASLVDEADAILSTTVNADDTLALVPFQMDPGTRLVIEFDALLMDRVQPGQVLNNITRVSYTSLVDGGRDNSSGPGTVDDDDDSMLDNYEESTGQALTVAADVAIDKTADRTEATVGQVVAFTLRIDLIEGATPAVTVHDSLPDGLVFQQGHVYAGNTGMIFGNASYDTPMVSGQEIEFEPGDVTNPANGDTGDDYFTVRISARVANVQAIQDGVVLKNGEAADGSQVYVRYGETRLDFDQEAGIPGIQGRPLTVLEPELRVGKTADPTEQSLGDLVTFTVEVAHTADSHGDVHDLILTDTLPAGFDYIGCSLPDAEVTVTGGSLEFAIGTLTLAERRKNFQYTVRVRSDAPVDTTLNNQIALTWAGLPGATGGSDSGRTGQDCTSGVNDYCADAATTVQVTQNASIDAVKIVSDLNGGNLLAGETIEYTIVLNNTNGPVTGVAFMDRVPATCGYVPGSLTTSKGTAADGSAPDLAVVIGAMAGGEMVTITFRATVNEDTPSGTAISNQGLVDSDATVPEPTDHDGNDANGDQPTIITVAGDAPEAGLTVWKLVEWVGDSDPSGTVSPGDTMRYRVVLENTGRTPLTNVAFTDSIPAGLSHNGQFAAEDGTLVVNGGTVTLTGMNIAPGDSSYLWFEVTIDDPLVDLSGDGDPNTEVFLNQGTASSDQTGSVPSDANGDPTDGSQSTEFTAVADAGSASPNADVEKRWSLAIDLNGDGIVNPGDTLGYSIVITNTGAAPATNIRLLDDFSEASNNLGNYTTLVDGSLTTSQGVVVSTDPVDVNIGTVNPTEMAVVSYRVTLDGIVPSGTVLSNQATVHGASLPSTLSDDNTRDEDGLNPTLTPIVSRPNFADVGNLTKEVAADGDLLTYTIRLQNTGDAPAEGLVLIDGIPRYTQFVSGSIRLNGVQVTDEEGYDPGLKRIDLDLGALGVGQQLEVIFQVKVAGSFSGGIYNQGSLGGDNLATEITDDPATDAVDDATLYRVPPKQVPLAGGWGLLGMVLACALAAVRKLNYRDRAGT